MPPQQKYQGSDQFGHFQSWNQRLWGEWVLDAMLTWRMKGALNRDLETCHSCLGELLTSSPDHSVLRPCSWLVPTWQQPWKRRVSISQTWVVCILWPFPFSWWWRRISFVHMSVLQLPKCSFLEVRIASGTALLFCMAWFLPLLRQCLLQCE